MCVSSDVSKNIRFGRSEIYGSLFVPHKRIILCRYNDIYVVITTSDGCRYNEILSRYNDLQWMSL